MKSTTLTVRHKNDVDIIDLRGTVLHNEEYEALHAAILCLVEMGSRRILINMDGLTIIKQELVWPPVQVCAETAKTGGKAKLLNVGQHVKTILHASGLYDLFEAEVDEDSAVRSFSAYTIPRSGPGSEYFIG